MPAKIDHQSIKGVAKALLGAEPIPDLQAHFNNPENKRRFNEWQQKRREANAVTTKRPCSPARA